MLMCCNQPAETLHKKEQGLQTWQLHLGSQQVRELEQWEQHHSPLSTRKEAEDTDQFPTDLN